MEMSNVAYFALFNIETSIHKTHLFSCVSYMICVTKVSWRSKYVNLVTLEKAHSLGMYVNKSEVDIAEVIPAGSIKNSV